MVSFVVVPAICNQHSPYISVDPILNSKLIERQRQSRDNDFDIIIIIIIMSSHRPEEDAAQCRRWTDIERVDLAFWDTHFLSYPSIGGTQGYGVFTTSSTNTNPM